MQESARGKSGFNTPAVLLCGLALIIFLYALSLFLQGGFLASQNQVRDTKILVPVNEPLQDALAEQRAILEEQPRWLDDQHTKACMPIEDAMARVIQLNGGDAPAAQGEEQ